MRRFHISLSLISSPIIQSDSPNPIKPTSIKTKTKNIHHKQRNHAPTITSQSRRNILTYNNKPPLPPTSRRHSYTNSNRSHISTAKLFTPHLHSQHSPSLNPQRRRLAGARGKHLCEFCAGFKRRWIYCYEYDKIRRMDVAESPFSILIPTRAFRAFSSGAITLFTTVDG